jgi:hypothetical protein
VRASQFEPLWNTVDRYDALGTEEKCASNGELANWAAAPHGYRVTWLYAAGFGSLIAGRKNIREKKRLLSAEVSRNREWPYIGVRYSDIFRLPAGVTAEHVRITIVLRRVGRRDFRSSSH